MADYERIHHAFDPVFDDACRVLVLGSLPSAASREARFYYGNPRNRFWRVVASVVGEPVPADDDVAAKRALLLRHGIALWDVVGSCDIRGSSDASIRHVVPNDVARVLDGAPVEAVLCNGGTAGCTGAGSRRGSAWRPRCFRPRARLTRRGRSSGWSVAGGRRSARTCAEGACG